MPLHGAAFVKQTLTRPQPRTIALSLGSAAEPVKGALERTPDPPERVLMVTDSLDFAPLRAAGVGFEYIPAEGEAQAAVSGKPYEEFVRERLALILAERRLPRRVLAMNEYSRRFVDAVRVR
jgi:hypothetical protein